MQSATSRDIAPHLQTRRRVSPCGHAHTHSHSHTDPRIRTHTHKSAKSAFIRGVKKHPARVSFSSLTHGRFRSLPIASAGKPVRSQSAGLLLLGHQVFLPAGPQWTKCPARSVPCSLIRMLRVGTKPRQVLERFDPTSKRVSPRGPEGRHESGRVCVEHLQRPKSGTVRAKRRAQHRLSFSKTRLVPPLRITHSVLGHSDSTAPAFSETRCATVHTNTEHR